MGLEEMLASRMGMGGGDKTLICGNEREAIAEKLIHIDGLKAGDKVQWKRGMRDSKIPQYDQVAEVFRVFPIRTRPAQGSNHDLDEINFSILFRDSDGDISEHGFDSRRFERVD